MKEIDLRLADRRVLHVYDSAPGDDGRLAVVWHHATPHLGVPPIPLFEAGDWLGIRWVSFDRPGYGRSTANPDRTVSSVIDDLTAVVDTLGIGTFAVMGYSGGGSYALATAAILRHRIEALVALAPLAPHYADALDWYDGMLPTRVASFRAAAQGRAAKLAYETLEGAADPELTRADAETLFGPWAWLSSVSGNAAMPNGLDGLVDDDCSYVAPWQCDLQEIACASLLVHGRRDHLVPSAHSQWLASQIRPATLRLSAADSHVSVINHAEDGLEWIRDQTG
jgi:pimeloyl-ACP methyl ester carboxylesterase